MLLKTFVPLSYQRIKYIVYVAMWSLVTVMCKCVIQLFYCVYCTCSIIISLLYHYTTTVTHAVPGFRY